MARFPAVHAIQDSYRIKHLSQLQNASAPQATRVQKTLPAEVDAPDLKTPPPNQINSMKADRCFVYAAQVMALNPPRTTDWSQVT